MYAIYLNATDPTSKPGEPKPGKLPSGNGEGEAQAKALEILKALPGVIGEPAVTQADDHLTVYGNAALPHNDAVQQAARQLYLAVLGDHRGLLLTVSGYVVDQAGVNPISTPAT